jgi:hypothetical protein
MIETNPEWDYELSRMRPIADNMVKARWLKAYVITKDGIAYQWTKLGLKKIKQLSDMWNELTPATFDPQYANVFWAIILRAAVVHGIRKSLKK